MKFEVVALPREKQDLLDENEQMMTIKEIIINDNPGVKSHRGRGDL